MVLVVILKIVFDLSVCMGYGLFILDVYDQSNIDLAVIHIVDSKFTHFPEKIIICELKIRKIVCLYLKLHGMVPCVCNQHCVSFVQIAGKNENNLLVTCRHAIW